MSMEPSAATPDAAAPDPGSWKERVRAAWPSVRRAFRPREIGPFLAAWLFLNTAFNLRYPGSEPALWYLWPSIDVVLVFCGFALAAALGKSVTRGIRVALLVLIVLARVTRLGDGVQDRYYAEVFHFYTDLPLVPEIVRFSHSTLSRPAFWGLALAILLALVLFVLAAERALGVAERYLRRTAEFRVFAVLTALACIPGMLLTNEHRRIRLVQGGLGASVLPRLRGEVSFVWNLHNANLGRGRAIADAEALLRTTPHGLERLEGQNVLLFLVESYGQTVVERPLYRQRVRPTFEAIESELAERGYGIVSRLLDSPTYGGRSWLAHATLNTAVRTADQLQYDLVLMRKPRAISSFFRDAGYKSVLVQPGTTRTSPRGEVYRFDARYFAADFGYAGPGYSWATMPDQFVIDFVHRREVAKATQPLFIEYVLVSSHAPWSDLPRLVPDWSAIGDGAIFGKLETIRFPVEWPDFENAEGPYVESIVYDFEVLRAYLRDFVTDDSLVIVLGDHQPVPEVTERSPSHGVPIHVFSRRASLLEPFRRRGYTPGMWPRDDGTRPGLELFLPHFLSDFSNPRAPAGAPSGAR